MYIYIYTIYILIYIYISYYIVTIIYISIICIIQSSKQKGCMVLSRLHNDLLTCCSKRLLCPICQHAPGKPHVTLHRINSTQNVEPFGLGQETDCKCSRRRKTVPEYLKWRGHRRKLRVRAFTLQGSRAECPGVAKFCQATQEAVPWFQNVGAQVCVLLRWCASATLSNEKDEKVR